MVYANFSELKVELSTKMSKAVDVLKRDLAGLRTGRASVNLLDNIMVMAYGAPTPINQVASVSTPEARLICVSVWDKSLTSAVEKAIRDSDLGLNPASDGTLVRIPIPALTEERRKELSKIASGYAEQTKVSVRNVRRDGMEAVKSMEKEKQISEDDRKSYEEEIQKLTDSSVAEIEKLFEEKQKDIMTI
ncbi:MAG: ribosome recycling factor [bacterium]|nr:ribosome recycling factor [bacterium]